MKGLGLWGALLSILTSLVVIEGTWAVRAYAEWPRIVPTERPIAASPAAPTVKTSSISAPRQAGALYEVTAYSHGCTMPKWGEDPPRRAANGRWPIADVTVAADRALHGFGDEILIEGVGFRTVGDRGRAIKGNRLDLFVDSCREARRFGRRWLRVYRVPAATAREARNEGESK